MSSNGSEFSTAATLELSLDDRSLQQVKQTIESEIGTTQLGVTDGGTASAQAIGGGRSQRRARQQLRRDQERNEYLAEMVDILDDMDGMGGGGGGGGLSSLGLGTGFALGGGGGGLLGRLSLGGGLAGPAALGGLLGLGGTRLLQETGIMEDIRESGQNVRENAPGGDVIGDAAQFAPVELGTLSLDIAQGDLSFSRTAELYSNRVDVLGNMQVGDEQADPARMQTELRSDAGVSEEEFAEQYGQGPDEFTPANTETPLYQQTPFEISEQIQQGNANAGDVARIATRGNFSDEVMGALWNQVDAPPATPDNFSSFTNPGPRVSSTRPGVVGPASDANPMIRRGQRQQSQQNVTYEQTAEAEANIDMTIDASFDDLKREVENATGETKRELDRLRERFERLEENIRRANR